MEKREIRVLVVEDSPTDIELLRQSMKDFKFLKCRLTEVRTAAGAEAAMANTRFEAVLLDLNLPDSRGLESLARVKASGKATAVIIMTVSGEQETILKALSMGAQNFIVKGDETAVSLERAIMFSVEREKSVEALREAEEKYRLLYTSMGQGLAVHDAVFNADGKMTDYVFREVNESFERLTGLKAKEIVGKRVRQAVPGV
ncbi:MAG TPA: response regulator, partial [Candidatus Goldiibacteriota bacterium]|nr:response regulator [Candidatus Goldiibacteriota bacterium]